MDKCPEAITDEVLQRTAHIPDSEVEQDIVDTETEIAGLAYLAEGYRLIAEANAGNPEGKMAAFRQSAAEIGAKERGEFVQFLRRLQQARQARRLAGPECCGMADHA